MSFLDLQGLTKLYDGHAAVADLSISIRKGEFVALLGPSGCGKTTTLQMVAGFVNPTNGNIVLDGRDITGVPANKRGLGIMFQSYALFPHMSVAANVAFGLEMRGLPRKEIDVKVKEALELIQLGKLGARYPKELSGGQRQRVALARAIVVQPQLLLLDEPLGALDAKLREDMQVELRSLQHKIGVTTIMVTHDQEEAMTLADRVVVMNHGKIEQMGSPTELYERPTTRFVSSFLGKTNLFQGQGKGRIVTIGGIDLPSSESGLTGAVDYMIRPEKISLVAPGVGNIDARIESSLFVGDHWLVVASTEIGRFMMRRPNDGQSMSAENEAVGLSWDPIHARTLAHSAGEGS